MTMTTNCSLLAAALLALVAGGCGGDDTTGAGDLGTVVRVNNASDEVLLEIDDLVLQGQVTVDDSRAVTIVSPEPGASLPTTAPPEFAWSSPSIRPRHGVTTGEFVWMRLSGGGLAEPIDMIAVDSTNWTPDGTIWAELAQTTGPVTITLTNAYVDGGNVMEGPFRGTNDTTFTIAH
jgi:hypothetical protein